MKFVVTEKSSPGGLLLVITDREILNQRWEEGKLQLDLTSLFYQGTELEQKEVMLLLEKARHLHLTGENAVALGMQLNYVNPERVLRIKGVPHAEVVIEE